MIFCDRCRIGKFELGKPCPVCGGVGTGQTVTIPDLAKKYALHQKTKGAKLDTAKLAEDHWGYVDMVLIAHGEDLKTRKACGSAYKLGMTLGLSGDSETYNLIMGVFSEGVDPGSYYTKIKTHLETAYEHGVKHAKEAV